jgi:hypothetical protein
MTDEQTERLIRALETIAARLQPFHPLMPVPPAPGYWPMPARVPVTCMCPPGTVCGSVNCPRRPSMAVQFSTDVHSAAANPGPMHDQTTIRT